MCLIVGCIGTAICCAGSSCCGCLCAICKACGVNKKTYSKIGFVFFSLFWAGISIALLYTAKEMLDWTGINCPPAAGGGSACMGVSAIYRMSFTLVIFHLFVFLMCLTRSNCAAMFHDGCWGTKFLMVLAGFIATMWIPNDFF